MHTAEDMARVRQMLGWGFNDREVGRELGIAPVTIGRWRRGETVAFGPPARTAPWRPPHDASYAYLLGLYLGDGHIMVGKTGKAWLRIFLDGIYSGIIDEAATAIGLTTLGRLPQHYGVKNSRVAIVHSSWKRWPEAFPQHGRGRKHERAIVLEDWQQEIADAHPDELVRGLIHSDGCRTVNRFTTKLPSGRVAEYEYPRYFFSNLSPEIRQIFRDACAALGVKTTMSNARNVSVSHRKSVAVLEEIVGPKA